MINDAEEKTSKFYNSIGWQVEGEITEDAKRWEDLREYAKEYVSKCRLRLLKHIPSTGKNLLDMASGPIQYPEYLTYSKNFEKRYCVDLSLAALELAEKKIGEHGVFLHGSFFDIPIEENFFDCTVSLHTIYHIDKEKQEEAVRKLVYVTKPGQPVIIVYSNPNSFNFSFLPWRIVKYILRRIKRLIKPVKITEKTEKAGLYFFSHPNDWWNRFADISFIKIMPWRSFNSAVQKKLIPNNKFGERMFRLLFSLEERFPRFFVKFGQYPMIILKKNRDCTSPNKR